MTETSRKKAPRKKTAKTTKAMADRLAGDPGRWVKPSPIERWFETRADARELVDLWIEMASAGESTWSCTRLHRELVEEFGFPFPAANSLASWMRRNYGPLYRAAISGSRA